MDIQLSLYEEEENLIRAENGKIKYVVKTGKNGEKYDKEYCLNQLRTDEWIWDMRAWDNYKDRTEVEEWVKEIKEKDNYPSKNSGHAAWCIRQLHKMGVDSKEIVDAIMKNPHKQYAKRLARCFDQPMKCKFYAEKKSYADCPCEKCK